MTDYGLLATGFRAKTTQIIFDEMVADLKALLGEELNTESDSILGILLFIIADRIAEDQELGQAVYAAGDPDQAEGDALATLAAMTGTTPLGATYSTVELVATGDVSTLLEVGRIVSVDGASANRFLTIEEVTLAAATAWQSSTAYAVGDIVTNGSNIYRCTTAGTSHSSGGPTGTGTSITDNTAVWRWLGEGEAYAVVSAQGEEKGPVVGNAYTITVIETPASGWSNVTNIEDASVGTNPETDPDLRTRRVTELDAQGKATVDTIVSELSKVTGVIDVVAFENESDSVVDGQPAHSMHIIVQQGTVTDAVIAQAIFDVVGAGIQTHGSESAVVKDSKDNNHTIRWDWAEEVEIYVAIEVDALNGVWPSDGVTQLQEALVSYNDSLRIGRDVKAEKARSLAWQVEGLHDIVAFDIEAANPPSGSANIAIGASQYASLDTGRIDVTVNLVDPS